MCEFFILQAVCHCPAGEQCIFAGTDYAHTAHGVFFHYSERSKVGVACERRKQQYGQGAHAHRACPYCSRDYSDPQNDPITLSDVYEVCKACEFRCTGEGVPKTRSGKEGGSKTGKKGSKHRTSKARYIRY